MTPRGGVLTTRHGMATHPAHSLGGPRHIAKGRLKRRTRHIEYADYLVRKLDATSFFAAAR